MNVVTSNQERKLTQPITENPSAPDWGLATIMGDILPPRDPNEEEDDEDDEEEDDEDEDESDDERGPAVIREPDEGD
jgi:hypothetical protein